MGCHLLLGYAQKDLGGMWSHLKQMVVDKVVSPQA